ncbi:TylF/MycF/NovP-related O-methyltransferase [Nonomuraea sp. NPDC050643]|uniref:TylF/MycF/NovP-related O-methyltransferase n=1 Tax=Nonomuraea sp. NPDC050643 TaxID=3155660 RepID=UPI0033E2E28C
MKINDGVFVAVADGRLVLGHVDRPHELWQVGPGMLALLAEVARGAGDLAGAMAPIVADSRTVVPATVARLRQAGLLCDEPRPALRDVNVEIAKVIAAAPDLHADTEFMEAARRCEGLTLTSPAAQYALWSATRYTVAAGIPGAVVECGVWRGGSMLLSALALLGEPDRDLYLFDTFDWSWEPPGDQDGPTGGPVAVAQMSAGASAEEVHARIAATGYPAGRIRCVRGLVQETVPGQAPDRIALLRLDTDQYESTRHELRELYPRVSPGGVVLIDDYGKLSGATRATDEYLSELKDQPLLHRIDTQGRIFVKPGGR